MEKNVYEIVDKLYNTIRLAKDDLFCILLEKIREGKEYNADELNDENPYYTIAYDGGNHPEYASNCFARIERVYVDTNNNCYIDTEDGEMDLDYISLDDMFQVWYFICDVEKSRNENE